MNDVRPWLCNAAATADAVRMNGIRFKKKYGQNFLIDERVMEKILKAADIGPQDFVLEIGPGIGTLTQYLAANARKVAAVEIDPSLIPVLEKHLFPWNNVELINDDFLNIGAAKIAEDLNEGRPVKVTANLPYYITTPIIMNILESRAPVESVTILIQKEVAERMNASPGTKEYGALTLAVNYYCDVDIAALVPANCFIPRPEVTSAVVNLKMKEKTPEVKDEKKLFTLIRAAFAQRRKTLVNCLRNSESFSFSRETAIELVTGCGFDENIRGETLSLEEFILIADRMV